MHATGHLPAHAPIAYSRAHLFDGAYARTHVDMRDSHT